MARQVIQTGTAPNDGLGDSVRVAGQKINANFVEVYDDISSAQANIVTIDTTIIQLSANVDALATLPSTVNALSATVDNIANSYVTQTDIDNALTQLTDSDSQTLSFDSNTNELTITDGNTVDLSGLTVDLTGYATESYVNTSIQTALSEASLSADLVNDTTPQLGGNLDTNGNDIVAPEDDNFSIQVLGTAGILQLAAQGSATLSSAGQITIAGDTNNDTTGGLILSSGGGQLNIVANTAAGGIITIADVIWPSVKGSTGQVLRIANATTGGLEWAAVDGGGGGLASVVDDTTPQLGGNLDTNGNNITGTGDINLANGDSGFVVDTSTGSVTINGDGTNSLTFQNPAFADGVAQVFSVGSFGSLTIEAVDGGSISIQPESNLVLDYSIWPVSDGTDGQVLTTDGDGALSWTTITESDTLDDVTGRGASTTNNISVGAITCTGITTGGTGDTAITASQNLNLEAGNAVVIVDAPIRLGSFTATERDSLAPSAGDMIYNNEYNRIESYTSTSWGPIGTTHVFDIGANGTSDYTFSDSKNAWFPTTENDPVLYLRRGETYVFENNSGGAHPFEIRVSNGGAAYNTGVTNNAAATGNIIFTVPMSAPATLYYQCTNHASMGNTINIV